MIALATGVYRLRGGELLVRGLSDWILYVEVSGPPVRWKERHRFPLSTTAQGIEVTLVREARQ